MHLFAECPLVAPGVVQPSGRLLLWCIITVKGFAACLVLLGTVSTPSSNRFSWSLLLVRPSDVRLCGSNTR